jgi:hypothetical protein
LQTLDRLKQREAGLTRAEIDQLAWTAIHPKKPYYRGTKPDLHSANCCELDERLTAASESEIAWGDFLHAFYSYNSERPPAILSIERSALLAGVAELLCVEFGVEVAVWIEEPQYFLPEIWDAVEEFFPFQIGSHIPRSGSPVHTRSSLKRNVLLNSRHLIALC